MFVLIFDMKAIEMIGITKLYCGKAQVSDVLRYNSHSGKLPSHLLQFSGDKKPVVVWNCTRACNLKCVHCYSGSGGQIQKAPDELSTAEAKAFLSDLGSYGSPVILFSGGEPLTRPDLIELIEHAKSVGLRAVISTNGTLITDEKAKILSDIGLSYVGVSLDGLEETHDGFRGKKGAFKEALAGIRACLNTGVKVGVRFTLNKTNQQELPGLFDLLEKEGIPRCCFYHLVYTGREKRL